MAMPRMKSSSISRRVVPGGEAMRRIQEEGREGNAFAPLVVADLVSPCLRFVGGGWGGVLGEGGGDLVEVVLGAVRRGP